MDKKTFLTALSASALTIAAIYAGSYVQKRKRLKDLKKELEFDLLPREQESNYSEELVREQLARNYAFLGEDGMARIRGSFVVIVGLGGVGSHAAHMLVRAGVKRIRVIDFDQVTLSSLNRHAVATLEDVGTSKALCLVKHFKRIAPHVTVEAVVDVFRLDKAASLLAGNPDYVLDCIDNLGTKVDLIRYCVQNKIKVMSSMGAGAKSDPSRVCIADLSDTQEDPLARAVRRTLSKQGFSKGVTVVYSVEKPKVKLLPLDEEKVSEADQYAALPNFRSRILPVLGPIPAIFGNAMATHIITQLAGYPTEPMINKLRKNMYESIHRQMSVQEKDDDGKVLNRNSILLRVSDVGYLIEEVWQGRSALSKSLDKLTLVKWNPDKPLYFGNLVCMTKSEAEKHRKLKFDEFESVYPKEFLEFVKQRFELEDSMNQLRY